jgi:hypothetical protein
MVHTCMKSKEQVANKVDCLDPLLSCEEGHLAKPKSFRAASMLCLSSWLGGL